jgi:hypothetical protein
MTDQLHYFCPQCQGLELEVHRPRIVGVGDSGYAHCKLCGWKGKPDELLAALSPGNAEFWTSERIANVLLNAAAKHAAGPMVQVLELIGIVPRIQGDIEEQQSAQGVREGVVKAVLEAVVTAAFRASAELAPAHYERFHPRMAEATGRVFRYGEHDA